MDKILDYFFGINKMEVYHIILERNAEDIATDYLINNLTEFEDYFKRQSIFKREEWIVEDCKGGHSVCDWITYFKPIFITKYLYNKI